MIRNINYNKHYFDWHLFLFQYIHQIIMPKSSPFRQLIYLSNLTPFMQYFTVHRLYFVLSKMSDLYVLYVALRPSLHSNDIVNLSYVS